jgi:hypothetical protein
MPIGDTANCVPAPDGFSSTTWRSLPLRSRGASEPQRSARWRVQQRVSAKSESNCAVVMPIGGVIHPVDAWARLVELYVRKLVGECVVVRQI